MSLDLRVQPAKTDDGRLAMYFSITNLKDEPITLTSPESSFNPQIQDSDGNTYTPSIGYAAVVTYLTIQPKKSFVTSRTYESVEQLQNEWDDKLDFLNSINESEEKYVIHDPQRRGDLPKNANVYCYPAVDIRWKRELTVTFSITYDETSYTDSITFQPCEVEAYDFEEFTSDFDVDEDAEVGPF